MKITRDGVDYELTRQELSEAHEAYEYELAKEVITERAKTEVDNDVSEAVIETGIETYLDRKDGGCEEDFCISEAVDAMRSAHAEEIPLF